MEQTAEITWFPVSLRKHPDTDREVLITIQCIRENTTYEHGIRHTETQVRRYTDMGCYDSKHRMWELSDGNAMYGTVIAWAEKPAFYTGDGYAGGRR